MKKILFSSTLILIVIALAACGPISSAVQSSGKELAATISGILPQAPVATLEQVSQQSPTKDYAPVAQATPGAPAVTLDLTSAEIITAYQNALNQIYQAVNPSVVNIQVIVGGNPQGLDQNFPQIPNFPFGDNENPGQTPRGSALGSGFVWDKEGHIATNNHVVEDAVQIEVTFSDGKTVPATLVGRDPDSDLAVIKVDVAASDLKPVSLADSSKLAVGQLAVAIGNPFGLEGSMSTGIVSAIGRVMPARDSSALAMGPSYSIPDVIQTDASINPGNSGGVLVNDQGQLIGVTFMIESQSGSNSGVGFAIPSTLVKKVVPALIKNGEYQHTYIGISGMTLEPSLAKAMGLDENQRGALIGDVTPGGPAASAALRGSTKQATVSGQQIMVGGDVIIGIDNAKVESMDDLIAYLANNTTVGQKVTLTIIRDGKQMNVDVVLQARPKQQASITQQQPSQQPRPDRTSSAYLGIVAGTMIPKIAEEMGLPEDQTGVLIEQVQIGSPADEAGLLGSTKSVTINGQPVMVGGDVIIALNGETIASMEDLSAVMRTVKPGDQITVTILRDGKQLDLQLTVGSRQGVE